VRHSPSGHTSLCNIMVDCLCAMFRKYALISYFSVGLVGRANATAHSVDAYVALTVLWQVL
jgi:hypothetical protein